MESTLKKKASKLKCSPKIKERINRELERYDSLNSHSPELGMEREYLDWLLELPWNNYTKDNETEHRYIKILRNLSTGKMLLIVALPFTPAFAVNIAAGILKIDIKKYLTAILFGKISLVIYSAYIGTSFVEGLSNPIILLNLVILIFIIYILFLIVKKLLKLNL